MTQLCRYAGAVDLVCHHNQRVVDSVTNRQPVELAQQRVCVAPPRSLGACRTILAALFCTRCSVWIMLVCEP